MEKLTYSTNELTKVLGVSRQLIYELVRYDKIPYLKVGKKLLFSKERINKWLNETGKAG